MEGKQLKSIIQAALMAAGRPLSVDDLFALFNEEEEVEVGVSKDDIRQSLKVLQEEEVDHCFIIKEVASGFCYQIKTDYAPWLSKLWKERAPRYSRATLETLVIIAYRQPITRGEIEEIRGVAVASTIVKTLLEREWIRIVGYRDLPGKPAIYGTTKSFLDYFNLKNLSDLPTLDEVRNRVDVDLSPLDQPVNLELNIEEANTEEAEQLDEQTLMQDSDETEETLLVEEI